MTRSVIMIVCNGNPFITPQLHHIYDIVDEIVIVEGADQFFKQVINSERSTDGTIKEINKFIKNYDKSNKIKFIQPKNIKNKNSMVKIGNENCSGKYIYSVDVDEFLPHNVIEKAFKLLEKVSVVLVPERCYYKWYDTYLCSNRDQGIFMVPGRFFVNKIDEGLIISHIPWNGYMKNGKHIDSSCGTLDFSDYGRHYMSVHKFQLENKFKYYTIRGDCGKAHAASILKEFKLVKRTDVNCREIKSYKNMKLTTDKNDFFVKLPNGRVFPPQ